MNNKKLKVVWLCYFTNSEVQDYLKPHKRVGEIAPWITNMIPVLENDPNIELHVVSEHRYISGIKSFVKNNVNYHFFSRGIPYIGKNWPGFFRFDIFTNYYALKQKVAKIIHKIEPDIIHLHGAENEFCTAIIQFQKKYPVFITIQGFVGKATSNSKVVNIRKRNEIEILKNFNHFGYRTLTMGEDVKAINPNAELHWHMYPMKTIKPLNSENKFDLVFFARMTTDKGIEDLLKAVALIKKDKPDISLCAIGGGKTESLQQLVNKLGIENNVTWAGFLPTQEDVHKMASTAKISVLPTYHDIISGTIIESLFLKLPVVAYNVGSIHEVNKHEEIISLVEKFDLEGLAKSVLELLNNENLQKERAEKGYQRAIEMFDADNDTIREDLLKAYKGVIEDFHNMQDRR